MYGCPALTRSNAMTLDLLAELAAYIPRDRVEALLRGTPLAHEGVASIADISGFTPLTEALTSGLSADQGAEALTRALDSVFTPLIAEIHASGGSVIKFGGDALIVWHPRPPRARRMTVLRAALTAAWRMQHMMATHGRILTPIGPVMLQMKIGMAFGPVRRFAVGLPEYGIEDALVGRTLDRMAEAEHHARPGEIVIDADSLAIDPLAVEVATERDGFVVVGRVLRPLRRRPWPPLLREAGPDTLVPYVPEQVARALAAGHPHIGELKPVVSMFVQFHGLDYDGDDDAGAKLQLYFAMAQRTAGRFGGRVNRLITGDKGSLLHVIFGAPQAVEEQETRAVHCALALLREGGSLPFIARQRIGMTAGRVFAGPVGAPQRHDYTTMGDAINLSARLMQAAADHQALLDGTMCARLDDRFDIADLGMIRVKGKAEAVHVHAVLGVRAAHRPVAWPAAPALSGRERERNLLQIRLTTGGTHVLVGEAGAGKTHLIAVLRAGSDQLWAGAAAQAYGAQRSGALIADALRDLLGLATDDDGPDGTQRLAQLCDRAFGAPMRSATFPYLARFLGLPLTSADEHRIQQLAGESFRWRLFEVVRDLFRALAQQHAVVLALDDVQWADATSLDMIESLAPVAAEMPLTVLLALRPDRDTRAWGVIRRILDGTMQATELTLSGLDPAAAAELVARHAPGLPERLVAQIVERGGGNPLFLVELARTLHLRGPAVAPPDADLTALDLPDTLQGLLLAQIDQLPVRARQTLQMAAVIGRTFSHRVLTALAGDDPQLDTHLADLEHGAFITQLDRSSERGYAFRHTLVQECAYSTLLYERRRPLHRSVARALEQLFPQQVIDQAATLGFHYERAEDYGVAATHVLRAGDSARLIAADEEAQAFYRRALTLLDRDQQGAQTDQRRAHAYLRQAQVCANRLDFAGAQEHYEQAFSLLEINEARHTRHHARAGRRHTIRLGISEHGPATLDPGLIETVGDEEIVPDLFEGLVELDAELNVLPALARRWQIDDQGRRYRFELRPGLRWSDGVPLTAHDVVFAWRRNLDPATDAAMADLLDVVAGAVEYRTGAVTNPEHVRVKAIDDLHLEFELHTPLAHALYLLADPITFPQPRHAFARHGAACFTPAFLVCNGPYRVAAWHDGSAIVLERNPYRSIAPDSVERALLRFVPPTYDYYASGRIDMCRVEDRGDILAHHPDEGFVRQFLSTYFVAFNCAHPPFDDPHARRALAHAVDRHALVARCWAGVQKPADGGVVPPGMAGHSPEIGPRFDPRIALQLRDHTRLRHGGRLTLAALPGFGSVPRFLATAWHEYLDLDVALVEDVPYDRLLNGLHTGMFQMALLGCDAEAPEPGNMLGGFAAGASFTAGWRSTAFEACLRAAALRLNVQERLALYHQADHILVTDEAAIIPLYYYQAYGMLRSGLRLAGGKVVRGGQVRLKQIRVAPHGSAPQLPVFGITE